MLAALTAAELAGGNDYLLGRLNRVAEGWSVYVADLTVFLSADSYTGHRRASTRGPDKLVVGPGQAIGRDSRRSCFGGREVRGATGRGSSRTLGEVWISSTPSDVGDGAISLI